MFWSEPDQRLVPGPLLLKRNLAPEEITDVIVQSDDRAADFIWIRCPLCHWRPEASSRWYCARCGPPEYLSEGCGTVWNTFTTRGLCPGCGHQWRWTACLSCGGWSLHEDWYASEID